MISLRSGEIIPKSPPPQTLTPSSIEPSTPSKTLDQPPSMAPSPSTPKSAAKPPTPASNLRRSSRLASKSKNSGADVGDLVASNADVDEEMKKKSENNGGGGLDFDSVESVDGDKSNTTRVLGSSGACLEEDVNFDVVKSEEEEKKIDLDSKGKSVQKRKTRGSGSKPRNAAKAECGEDEKFNNASSVGDDVKMDVDSDREKTKTDVSKDEMDLKENGLDSRQDGEKKDNMVTGSGKLGSGTGSWRRSAKLTNAFQKKLDLNTSMVIDLNVSFDKVAETKLESVKGTEVEMYKLDSKEADQDRENSQNIGKVDLTPSSGGSKRRSERLAKTEQGYSSVQGRGKRKSGVDLNFPPLSEDGNGNGFLDSSPGSRSTRRKAEGGDAVMDKEREDRVADGSGDVEAKLVQNEGNAVNERRRYSREEKGKGSMVKENWLSIGMDPVDLELKPEEEHLIENAVSVLSLDDDAAASGFLKVHDKDGNVVKRDLALNTVRSKAGRRRQHRERHLGIARERASHFAHFNAGDEEDNTLAPVNENGEPLPVADQENQDWPGPFSTAMKIIRDRANNQNARSSNLTKDVSKGGPVIKWIPAKDQGQNRLRPSVPSLQDMCLEILSKHADALVSLENVPDNLRNKLCQLLCNSRRMDSHFMGLLARGSPSEICVKDSSCLTEEQITNIFGECNMKNLTVLQLDLCGRCMPDYVLRTTLARSPNSLTALAAISLRGACRLTDSGLSSLVASAPSLRSINLGQCSLLTSTGINEMANSLRSVMRELYIDECQNIDAMLILPALKKLEHLELLSVAGIQTVSNKFVGELVAKCGANLKELVLKNCGKLTDTSMKAIAESCSGLCALDIVNLHKLTDSSLGYLAKCQSIQMLKLCHNAFSDEAIAAFVEASGETLVELSINNVKEVGHNTAISLAKRCSVNLLHLDVSFCRKLSDEALGLIVDSCSSLKVLKMFGCTQVTNKFLDGHSNPSLQIIGLKMTPILKNRDIFEPQRTQLRYSSVPVTEH